MHLLCLPPSLLNKIADYVDTADIQNLILTNWGMCDLLRHHLWGHVHVSTINSRSNYTNTELRSFQGDNHARFCKNGSLFEFEHVCRRRYIRIAEHNLAEICIGLLHGWYLDAFSRIQTLTFDLPMLFPEYQALPVTARQMVSVDFGSLMHWFVNHLNPDLFLDLQRLEVTTVELMAELETPLVEQLLAKFEPIGVDVALFAATQENWLVRRPIKQLVNDNVKVLCIECHTLEDAYGLSNGPLPAGLERLDLHVESRVCDAKHLTQYLSRASNLSHLKINGDVVNPDSVNWIPAALQSLEVVEYQKPLTRGVGKAAAFSTITRLHVHMQSGSIYNQLHLPHLKTLWVTHSFGDFYVHHFEALNNLMKGSSKIVQLRMQGIPYDQVARLVSMSGCDMVESLVVEYAGFTRGTEQFTNRLIRKGAMRLVRELPRLRTLVIDLLFPKPRRVVEVLAEFVQFCPNLNQVLCCMRDQDLPWLNDYKYPVLWDGHSMVDLGKKYWSKLDIRSFGERFITEEPEEQDITGDSAVAAALVYLSVNG